MNQEEKKDAVTRLKKIEGQVRGIHSMVDTDRYCIDILSQTRAVVAAIRKVEDLILFQHLHTCVADSMRSDNEEDKNKKISEIMDLLSRYRKNG